MQAFWMLFQCCARKASRLPLSILEIHTLAHVLCAIPMFCIWWCKPRQTESPTILNGDWTIPLAAYMFSASSMSAETSPFADGKPQLSKMVFVEDHDNELDGFYCATEMTSPTVRGFSNSVNHLKLHVSNGFDSLADIESTSSDSETLSRRMQLAEQAVALFPALRTSFESETVLGLQHSQYTTNNIFKPFISELVQPYIPNWGSSSLIGSSFREAHIWKRINSAIAPVCYGAIHIVAITAKFPTGLEKQLWLGFSIGSTVAAVIEGIDHFSEYEFYSNLNYHIRFPRLRHTQRSNSGSNKAGLYRQRSTTNGANNSAARPGIVPAQADEPKYERSWFITSFKRVLWISKILSRT
jgi:hypothetical protein